MAKLGQELRLDPGLRGSLAQGAEETGFVADADELQPRVVATKLAPVIAKGTSFPSPAGIFIVVESKNTRCCDG